jgi:hypothetical protein
MTKSQQLWRTVTVLVRLDMATCIAITLALIVVLAGRLATEEGSAR